MLPPVAFRNFSDEVFRKTTRRKVNDTKEKFDSMQPRFHITESAPMDPTFPITPSPELLSLYQAEYSNFRTKTLAEFNQNPHFKYENDTQDFNVADYTKTLPEGFKLENNDPLTLYYEGDQPAQALDELLKLKTLILDCNISLTLIDLLF